MVDLKEVRIHWQDLKMEMSLGLCRVRGWVWIRVGVKASVERP